MLDLVPYSMLGYDYVYYKLYINVLIHDYVMIYLVTILLPVAVSTIYTTKSCTKNLAKIRHKNATCASHLLIFAQPVAIWRGLQGGIIVCEKKKTTPRRTPGLSVQLRCRLERPQSSQGPGTGPAPAD